MLKYAVPFVVAGMLATGAPSKSAFTGGSYQVDAHHSDIQLVTDATSDYGKRKIDITLGFARVNGRVELNNDDLAKSSFDIRIYPADSMLPAINEEGKFLSMWLADLSNHTLICFHSKGAVRTAEGRLQTTGNLIITRVDRNVESSAPSEAYAGPVYGQPIVHRVSHEATFVFDAPSADGKGQKDGGVVASGSTRMFREDFPQLVRAVLATYWPPVVQDRNCQPATGTGEDYQGNICTGTVLMAAALPEVPHASNAEDYPGPGNFNVLVGNRLNILVHLHLLPQGSAEQTGAGT